jgi:hypothetical protein
MIHRLENTGVWAWREAPARLSGISSRTLRGAGIQLDEGSRDLVRNLVLHYSAPSWRRTAATGMGACATGLALWIVLWQRNPWAVWCQAGPHGCSATKPDWWAGPRHDAGAVWFMLIAMLGSYLVLAQNYAAFCAVRVLAVARSAVRFQADWLNLDGAYGWDSFRQAFELTFGSVALRAIQLTAVMIALGLRSALAIGLVTLFWACFLDIYVWYPFRLVETRFERLRSERLRVLKMELCLRGTRA